jgi:hypothetical protein
MNRRNFLNRIMGAAAGLGLAGTGAAAVNKLVQSGPKENQSVTYKVKGFT